MSPPAAESLHLVLEAFGLDRGRLLGAGGEAEVYELDARRVLRVLHGRVDPVTVERRRALLDELRSGGAPFDLPEILDADELAGRSYTIERRLRGRPVSELLATADGVDRVRLIEHHLEAAAALGGLSWTPRGWFGDLLADAPIRSDSWREYLSRRAAASLASAPPEFASVDAAALSLALPPAEQDAFVHLDAFAGNMLAVGTDVTAVIDIGPACVAGDRRLDPLASAVYLLARETTPAGRAEDADVVGGWLRSAGLADHYSAARRWLAAYWSFATDDVPLQRWCRGVLVA